MPMYTHNVLPTWQIRGSPVHNNSLVIPWSKLWPKKNQKWWALTVRARNDHARLAPMIISKIDLMKAFIEKLHPKHLCYLCQPHLILRASKLIPEFLEDF